MKIQLLSTFLLLTSLLPALANAQCHLDGRSYDEGTVIAGYVCKDGDWVKI